MVIHSVILLRTIKFRFTAVIVKIVQRGIPLLGNVIAQVNFCTKERVLLFFYLRAAVKIFIIFSIKLTVDNEIQIGFFP